MREKKCYHFDIIVKKGRKKNLMSLIKYVGRNFINLLQVFYPDFYFNLSYLPNRFFKYSGFLQNNILESAIGWLLHSKLFV